MDRNRSAIRRPRAALAASLLAHGLLLVGLALELGRAPRYPVRPVIEIRLIPAWTSPRPLAAAPASSHTPPAQFRERGPTPPPGAPSIPAPSAPPTLGAPAAEPMDSGLVAALRGSVGCRHADLVGLSLAEREHCLRRTHALGRDAPAYAAEPADPVKAAAFDRAAAENEAQRRYMEGDMPPPPYVGAWHPPCVGVSCPKPLVSQRLGLGAF